MLTGLIHCADPTGLPYGRLGWMDKSRLFVEEVVRRCPAAAPDVRAVVARLGGDVVRLGPTGQLIHDDFTARNLICTRILGPRRPATCSPRR
jgi:hypothetical protein